MAAGKPRNVLVLGAGYAGLVATTLRLSRRAGSGARVTVVSGSDAFVERHAGYCVSLGRRGGVLQRVRRDGVMTETISGTLQHATQPGPERV